MHTSYFHKSWKEPTAVSIALKHPPHYTGREYRALAPPSFLVYDHSLEWFEYVALYQEKVLDRLNPRKVFDELGEDAILLCWESPEKQCHRHLVAAWLEENLGVRVEELSNSGQVWNPKSERFRQTKLL